MKQIYVAVYEPSFCLFSDEPVITHGLTFTSKIRFRDVVQVIRVRIKTTNFLLFWYCFVPETKKHYPQGALKENELTKCKNAQWRCVIAISGQDCLEPSRSQHLSQAAQTHTTRNKIKQQLFM